MNILFITKKNLCSGCGACTVICPIDALKMIKTSTINIPGVFEKKCVNCGKCLKICPGYDNYLRDNNNNNNFNSNNAENSSVQKSFICHAKDPIIRNESSSGGYVTTLLTELLKNEKLSGIVTLKPGPDTPYEYSGGLIKDIAQLMRVQGSIYYPVSVCEGIKEIINLDGQFAFVGKPCDVHAVRLLSDNVKGLRDKLPLLISIFCSGTPTRANNQAMISVLKLPSEDIERIKYRGLGWPGKFQVFGKNGRLLFSSSYREIWDSYLSQQIPIPCKLCCDPYGKYADISVGDAWGFNDATELGLSAVFLRTKNGENFHTFIEQRGDLICSETTPQQVFLGQPSLQAKIADESIVKEIFRLNCEWNLKKIFIFLLNGRTSFKIKLKTICRLYKIYRSR